MGARGAYQFGAYLPTSPGGPGQRRRRPVPRPRPDRRPGAAEHAARRRPARDLRSPASRWRSSGCRARPPTRSPCGCRTSACSRRRSACRASAIPNLYTSARRRAPPGRPVGALARRAARASRPTPWPRATAAPSSAPRPAATTCATTATSIAWTHDQTVRYMNQGYVPDQIVEQLGDMPPHLRAYETTGIEGYGSVPARVASIYAWYLGFNPGEVTDFDPAPYERRQRGLRRGHGRRDRVKDLARDRHGRRRQPLGHRAARLRRALRPHHTEARELSAAAHRREGYRQRNATWRNWYLSAAEELDGHIPVVTDHRRRRRPARPAHRLARGRPAGPATSRAHLVRRRDPRRDRRRPVRREFTFHLRRGVLEVTDGAAQAADAALDFADKDAFVDYLTGRTSPTSRMPERSPSPATGAATSFAGYFDPPPTCADPHHPPRTCPRVTPPDRRLA